tara:strand:- start:643 stop:1482 length:840 start_codon:yes stop_codon:yes gene_type:complete
MKVLFIGNRSNVLQELLKKVDKLEILALKDSYLEAYCINNSINYLSFVFKDKDFVIKKVTDIDYDILVSNGCPFILPIVNRLMLNIHPTYLPYLKGKSPINGVIYNSYKFFGATIHLIDSGVDTGKIIFRKKIELTDDIDLGLVYYLSFELEKEVFMKGWCILNELNFKADLISNQDNEEGSVFNRSESKRVISFKTMSANDIHRVIRAFGIYSQGALLKDNLIVNDKIIDKIYESEVIVNSFLNNKFKNEIPGSVVLKYDNKFLIKCLNGLIKIKSFS